MCEKVIPVNEISYNVLMVCQHIFFGEHICQGFVLGLII
jgi:hypothetical protein